ncbi:hypothetical protein FRACA_1530005 [Frankia canadensis]|uniref:Uncharacterized protein n=1 Tax=Frankia canadensis TaxID=1836972 RepID=A0A2I2KM56_9ACTN|nr:hypothetical protein FRACA_1530005 [Frankia canadensis]SOU54033.1 hypothetical protein FRACA_1530005 [Frankia canadensis]
MMGVVAAYTRRCVALCVAKSVLLECDYAGGNLGGCGLPLVVHRQAADRDCPGGVGWCTG